MFADRLKKYRKASGLTQRDMSTKLFISQQAYAKYETGASSPNPDMLASIANILNVPADLLLSDTGTRNYFGFEHEIMTIGARIKKKRSELGMTQDELAKKMGYTSRSTIAKIESGENDIPQSKIEHFAKALQTTPAYLMGWEDNEKPLQTNTISDTGQRIKEKRLSAGISVEELSEHSNVSADLITRLETGVPTSFDSKILRSIARVLKTNMDYLAGWSDDGSKLDPPNPLDAIFDMPQQPVAYIHGSDGASKTITDKDMIDLIDKFFELMEKEKKDKK